MRSELKDRIEYAAFLDQILFEFALRQRGMEWSRC
jgi:hypothetical protein